MSDQPGKITPTGHSIATPDRATVKVSGELSDAQIEDVAGGGDIPLSVQQVTAIVRGLNVLHAAAWAV